MNIDPSQSTIKQLSVGQRIWLNEALHYHGIIPSCLNCSSNAADIAKRHRRKCTNEFMCEKFGLVPPLDVVVNGCPSWEETMPF